MLVIKFSEDVPGNHPMVDRESDAQGFVVLVERQAAIALRLVTEGLRLSGADPTRAKFMRALGRVALKTDYWPALDYRLYPLTGTGEWRFMELPALP